MEEPKNLWNDVDHEKYQNHVTISFDSTSESEESLVYMKDIEKRKKVYGICGECKEPGTGWKWCQPCNSKRSRKNFINWTSYNNDIDELIQLSQLNAVYYKSRLEWIPFEKFQNITYITKGNNSKIYSAKWNEGCIRYWDIEKQKWSRNPKIVALKSLNNSNDIDIVTNLLNRVKTYLQIYLFNVVHCYGITQDPNTKEYIMVLNYCENGDLRNYYLNSPDMNFGTKIFLLLGIARGLLNIHSAGKAHNNLHSSNILFRKTAYISGLGMCQPAQSDKKEEIYGVLPYIAPEVLREYQYTKASDIYSFGIIMNEFLSEEIPFNDIPHDESLAVKICKGFRPKILEDTPKFLKDLIIKCWDDKIENRPTIDELYQLLKKWNDDIKGNKDNEICSQIKECDEIREKKFKNKSNEEKPESHPQAIYTNRILNFKNLTELLN
ncbi:kinase-like domain-containing protein [Rhizophagus irregularis DAOM 181602=DAOM 197198]|uniref:Cdc15p n=3 Tax=Rhizophagus irregularis TaxID=588596 RepID=A0A015K4P6_RHIIW|nr:kinase-like domain-containing protein [Rhizophagus irregularis DAOM 181602=DAOM 197198]EXX62429.1 Cdc15p [Rhizophagus irregularis DAOM 197198w]POG63743.1 kinase-like domain-containing protein [Rhizophagus irregularis DAOM 181602=DAOM 197198]|eukprot:XP_025170609.1 kinase-like domain-containing protein [Rhizophagus irregularis DAOM 181602=DAOM 197198]